MKIVRLFARYSENPEEYLVLICQIDDQNRIDRKMESLGYVRDWDEDQDNYVKCPFLLTYEEDSCDLDYGYGEHPVEKTNIHKKQIQLNEDFTRFYLNEEYLYTIEKIVDLPFNPHKI